MATSRRLSQSGKITDPIPRWSKKFRQIYSIVSSFPNSTLIAKDLSWRSRRRKSVGFVHAGFGPNADESQIDTTRGVVSLLLTHADHGDSQIADGLLAQAERYLAARGATTIAAIGLGELCPFLSRTLR